MRVQVLQEDTTRAWANKELLGVGGGGGCKLTASTRGCLQGDGICKGNVCKTMAFAMVLSMRRWHLQWCEK
jgi:hypothetical protein